MNPQGIPIGAEQDNGVDKTQDTIALYEKAEKIADLIGSEKAFQELQELKQVTIAKLRDLHIDTSNSLQSLQGDIDYSIGTITEDEYAEIEDEYADIEELLENLPPPDIPEELSGISNTDFANLSIDEAQRILSFLTDGYLSYPESSWGPASYTNTLSEANSQEDIRVAQQILIDKIHGEGTFERGYADDGTVIGYSAVEGGNFLRSQREFEQQLQSGEIFNALMFANYVKYQKAQNGGDLMAGFEAIMNICPNRKDAIQSFIKDVGADNIQITAVKNELISAGIFTPDGGIGDVLRQVTVSTISFGMESVNAWLVSDGVDGFNGALSKAIGVIDTTGAKWILGEELQQSMLQKLEEAEKSPENVHSKLFRVSSAIHDIGMSLYEVFPFLAGNPLEEAHRDTTQGIIKNIITSGSPISVGFTQGVYSVQTQAEFEESISGMSLKQIDNLDKTAIGTYLCSLESSGNLNKEYLIRVFGRNNLIALMQNFKDTNFGGEGLYMSGLESVLLRNISPR